MDERREMRQAQPDESIANDVTGQVHAIIGAAEGVADALRREAEHRAQARLREADAEVDRRLRAASPTTGRRLSGLSDEILDQGRSILTQLGEIASMRDRLQDRLADLDAASRRIREASAPRSAAQAVDSGTVAPNEVGSRPNGAPAGPPGEYRGSSPSFGESEVGAAEARAEGYRLNGARDVAVQMAIAGSTRAEVAAHLQRALDLRDPEPILNDVFGATEARRDDL